MKTIPKRNWRRNKSVEDMAMKWLPKWQKGIGTRDKSTSISKVLLQRQSSFPQITEATQVFSRAELITYWFAFLKLANIWVVWRSHSIHRLHWNSWGVEWRQAINLAWLALTISQMVDLTSGKCLSRVISQALKTMWRRLSRVCVSEKIGIGFSITQKSTKVSACHYLWVVGCHK